MHDYFQSFRDTTQEMSADQTGTTFEQKLKELTDRHIHTKHISNNKNHKPWINRNVKANLGRLKNLYHTQKTSGKQQDRKNHEKARRRTQKLERQYYWKYVEELIEDNVDDSEQQPFKQKQFWNYINSFKKDNSGISPLKDKGNPYNDSINSTI